MHRNILGYARTTVEDPLDMDSDRFSMNGTPASRSYVEDDPREV